MSNKRNIQERKRRMSAFCGRTPIMQRCFSNLDGYIIRVLNSLIKILPCHCSRSRSSPMEPMPRVGIFLDAATWHNESTTRRMKPISKQYTEMEEIRHSGAPSACCTIRSTSIVMPWMRIRAQSVSTRISQKFGTILERSMNLATTRQATL